jgi:PadR family transcriptional regulator
MLRLEQEGWISSRWGASEKNRKAKYYSITAAGRRQLAKEADDWQRMSSTIDRFLSPIQDTTGEEA